MKNCITRKFFYLPIANAMALDSKLNVPLLSEVDPEEEQIFTEAGEESLSVDSILEKWVGEFGRGQLVHFLLVSLAWGLEALHTFVVIFAGRQPDWQCNGSPYNVGFCSRDSDVCKLDRNSWEWVGKRSSIVSEWDLICGEEYKVGLAGSIFFLGAIFGAGLFGSLADSSLGRKGALRLACILTAIFGILTSLCPNYWFYLIARGMTGFGCAGIGLCSFVLATEPVGPSKRGSVGMSAFYFFSLGTMFLPALAYVSNSWRHLYFFTSLPALCYSLLLLPFVSESPRWFLVQGRSDTAIEVLRSFASKNNRILPAGIRIACEVDSSEKLGSDVEKCRLGEEPRKGKAVSILDLFRYKGARKRMVIMVAIWFLVSVIYYGISLNVVNIKFNLYLSVVVNAAVEMPAFALTAMLLDKYGRRSMLMATFLFSAVFCIVGCVLYAQPLSSSNVNDLRAIGGVICGALGIFAMAGTYNLVYIYTAELFPTEVRNAAMGVTTQAGQFGSMVAPLVVVLSHLHASLPFAVFAGAAVAGAMLGAFLPETMNEQLWETMEGMEGRNDC